MSSQAGASATTKVHKLQVPTSGRPNSARESLRLDAFLTDAIQESSRARLQACIKEGLVEVNGAVQSKSGFRLRPGDSVVLALPPPPPLSATPECIPLNIVFEDDDVLVVNKVGLLAGP
jgi:23S rRNA-/tRNA-specific pseudouridylate synthase